MAVVTSLGVSTASTTNATSYAAGSITPAANDLLIVFVTASGTVADGSITDTQSLGFTRMVTAVKATSADTSYLFVANKLAAASAEVITFNTSTTATGAVIQVLRLSGMTLKGAAAIRQIGLQNNQSAAGTPAPAFANAALTANTIIGLVSNATNPATMTAPTGFTELDDTGYATPTTGAECVKIDSGSTATTVTWGGTSASAFSSIIAEVDVGATNDTGLVQAVTAVAPTVETSWPITLPINVTVNNVIVVGTNDSNGVLSSILTMTDSLGNTYARQKSVTDSSFVDGEVWTALVTSGGACTITVTLASNDVGLIAMEYSGVYPATADQTAASAATTGTAMTTGATGTLSQANEVVVVIGVSNGVTGTRVSAGSGYHHNMQFTSSGSDLLVSMEDKLVAATTAVTGAMTLSATGHWGILVITLKVGSPPVVTAFGSTLSLMGVG